MSFPVTGVDGLGQGAEFMERTGFTNTGHFVLDSSWESVIELAAECSISPLDACSKAVEFNQVFSHSLVVTHMKCLEVSFSFAYGVVGSEVVFKLRHEFRVVVDPGGGDVGGESRFKPVQCSSFQAG